MNLIRLFFYYHVFRLEEIVLLFCIKKLVFETMRYFLISVFLCVGFIIQSKVYAQKIDTIIHINGNVMTGDFKRMNYGVVSWSMDGMGTISLEEPKIKTIKSIKQFEIKLKNGFIYFGSFDTSGIDRKVNIVIANGRELVDIDDIVEVYPIRKSFWMRTSGNFSLGLNYTKGSDVFTSVLSGNINYRKRKSYFNLAWDSNNTWQYDSLTATKFDVTLSWQRLLKKSWSIGASVGLSQNLELGTRLRINLTPLVIRDIVYNRWNRFWVGAGVSAQRESPYDTSAVNNDLVGIITAVWKVYKYTNPKIWVDSDISFIPYMTNSERYRANYNLNPKIGLVGNDLKIGFRFYYSYDSRPPNTNSTGSDWGINLEITYTLH